MTRSSLERTRRRDIRWLAGRALSAAVFLLAIRLLGSFAWLTAVELVLTEAAAAGAHEATLPRATRATIQRVVEGRLGAAWLAAAAHKVSVEHNGEAVLGACRGRRGDRFTVAVSASLSDVLPGWLCRLSGRPRLALVTACASRTVGPE